MKIIATTIFISILLLLNIVTYAQQGQGFTDANEAFNQYEDSLKDGKWMEYIRLGMNDITTRDSARLYRLVIYTKGKENGIARYYSLKDNYLEYERPYTDGVINGIQKSFFRNGQLCAEDPFVNGKRAGLQKTYNINGIIESESLFLDGHPQFIVLNYPNGKIKSKMSIKYTLINGLWGDRTVGIKKIYYENGMIESKIPYAEDHIGINGKEKNYYPTGKIKEEIPYTNNIINGIVNNYDSSGQLISRAHFLAGKKDGTEEGYYENGKVKYKLEYRQGIIVGEGERFDEKGKLE